MDHLQRKAEKSGLRAGKMIILPSSFTGSPRAMMQNYQDAMAIVNTYGLPDLFVTFTCNARWPEIQEQLEPGQIYSDRPDIVARVFNQKSRAFLKELLKDHVLGIVCAFVYVVELQKRGLPHIHLLLFLEENHKIGNSKQIDEVVCAEIPLKKIILNFMRLSPPL
jgi:hypothetical protein